LSERSPDVVVIGGGIVGTAAAAFLVEAGARVTLVEREGLASGASGANSGVIQHPFDPVLAALYEETLLLYRELSVADLGFRLGDEPAGLMYVAPDEAAPRYVARLLADAFPELPNDVLTGPALERLEPALAPGLWACRVAMGYPVSPGASTYAYATRVERGGAHIRLGRTATLDRHGDTIRGVVVDGRTIACDAVLVAAGPWTPSIVDPTGQWAPIYRTWGVVVEIEIDNGPTHVLEGAEIGAAIGQPADTDHVDFSLMPLPGMATVGSTFLLGEPDHREWVERILGRATEFVPAVNDAPIRGSRACARPQSVDARPLIGAVPGLRRLYVCAGHGPWGISTGPASARLVVDQILGRGPAIPPELDVARLGALY
jgi:glycine/D-amino acid oxidase-like deaminating enzyme